MLSYFQQTASRFSVVRPIEVEYIAFGVNAREAAVMEEFEPF